MLYIRWEKNLSSLDIFRDLRGTDTAASAFSTLGLRLIAVLDFLQGRGTLGCAEFCLLSGLLFNIVNGQTNNSPLDLLGAGASLLEVGLAESLLVKTAPCLGPYELSRFFTLEGQGLRLRRSQENRLSITADEELAGTGPNSVLGQSAEFSCCREIIGQRNDRCEQIIFSCARPVKQSNMFRDLSLGWPDPTLTRTRTTPEFDAKNFPGILSQLLQRP